jgi:hypothetical protein
MLNLQFESLNVKEQLLLPENIRNLLNQVLDLLHVVEGNLDINVFTDKVSKTHSHSSSFEFVMGEDFETIIRINNRDKEEYEGLSRNEILEMKKTKFKGRRHKNYFSILDYSPTTGELKIVSCNERENITSSKYPEIKHLVNPIMTACLAALKSNKYSPDLAQKRKKLGLELFAILNDDPYYKEWFLKHNYRC